MYVHRCHVADAEGTSTAISSLPRRDWSFFAWIDLGIEGFKLVYKKKRPFLVPSPNQSVR